MSVENQKVLIERLQSLEEFYWRNPNRLSATEGLKTIGYGIKDMEDASLRLQRFAPYLQEVFPETKERNGLIESPLQLLNQQALEEEGIFKQARGQFLLKMDSQLPISGSIKARGGIYEVLCLAEKVAVEHGFKTDENYSVLAGERYRDIFSGHRISVGSTGNLGLSIGIMGAALGFQVEVHMSQDAKEWKKLELRRRGVSVIEYAGDYSLAVTQAREIANLDPKNYFVDDENSKTLFLGYSVAAIRLKEQLEAMDIPVDDDHPLHVYLPCGVGGGPGGIAFGLKLLYENSVHCYFAEPVQAPCMLLGMATGLHDEISVQDIGLTGNTIADGLAVGRSSGFISRSMDGLLDACYTVKDEILLRLLYQLHRSDNIDLEPSALAGLYGPTMCPDTYGTHIAWATGGGMVPADIMRGYIEEGKSLMR
jgi:D-serine dehydratase